MTDTTVKQLTLLVHTNTVQGNNSTDSSGPSDSSTSRNYFQYKIWIYLQRGMLSRFMYGHITRHGLSTKHRRKMNDLDLEIMCSRVCDFVPEQARQSLDGIRKGPGTPL